MPFHSVIPKSPDTKKYHPLNNKIYIPKISTQPEMTTSPPPIDLQRASELYGADQSNLSRFPRGSSPGFPSIGNNNWRQWGTRWNEIQIFGDFYLLPPDRVRSSSKRHHLSWALLTSTCVLGERSSDALLNAFDSWAPLRFAERRLENLIWKEGIYGGVYLVTCWTNFKSAKRRFDGKQNSWVP